MAKKTSKKSKAGAKAVAKVRQPMAMTKKSLRDLRLAKSVDYKMCNPFNPKTQGCKYPDGIVGFSIPLQVRGLMALATSTTTGQNVAFFGAGFPYNYMGPSALAAGVYTLGSGTAQFTNATLTTVLGSGGTLRPVCGGIIIRTLQSAMNAQGTLIINKIPAGAVASGSWTSGVLYGDARTYAITAGLEVCVLFKPQGPVAYDFQPVNTSSFEPRDWDQISVEFFGCTTGSADKILEIEYLVNYEVIPSSANVAYQQLASPAKNNPVAREVTKTVWDRVGSVITGGVDVVTQKLERLAVEAAGAAIGGMLGGPPGAVAGGMLALTVD